MGHKMNQKPRSQAWQIAFLILCCLLFYMPTTGYSTSSNETHPTMRKIIAVLPTDFPPNAFLDPATNQPAGLAVDVLNEVAQRVDLQIEYVYAKSWNLLEEAVLAGKADLVTNLTMNEKRLKRMIFTLPTETVKISLIARASDIGYNSIESGMKIGVMKGGFVYNLLVSRSDITIHTYAGLSELLMDLLSGRVDLALTSASNILKMAHDAEIADRIRVIEPSVYETKRAMALRPGNEALRDQLNKGIKEFVGTAEYQILYQKWWGKPVPFWNTRRAVLAMAGVVAVLLTIFMLWRSRERKRAEEEKEKLEAQLHQAQKMESVGRLAGGVAHDFNNILSVILGYTELALESVDTNDPLHADLQEIYTAARRSVDITRQLLAFARKQSIEPKVLDLGKNVEEMLKILRQLIGEDIDLAWLPKTDLWPVKMDPSQLDQILANLCVNARDAIPGVGKITIEVDRVTFDEVYCADHIGFIPGEFVLLAVSDDGDGIEEETLCNIFEPFFTTKGVGRGTGLGLSTVYGVVKQNNGFINVYSELGTGTTFKIYLPRYAGEIEEIRKESSAEILEGCGEVVLVVEDESSILKMSHKILDDLGYNVLTAGTPVEAMALAEENAGKIHLLITDVIMPEMSGRELAERIHVLSPNIKILFMSGYTADVIAHRGMLEEGFNFVQKPFSKKHMAAKVRATLDSIKPRL